MLQHALKIGLVAGALGMAVQDAKAFGHHGGWGCGYGYGGYGYGGCGYGGYGYGWYGGYGGWDFDGWYRGYSWRPLASSSRPDPDSVILSVSVPADAKVTINGQSTKSTGQLRRYRYSKLQPAVVQAYRVRAEFVRDGKPIIDEKTVELAAGQTGSLAFSAAPNAQATDVVTSAAR